MPSPRLICACTVTILLAATAAVAGAAVLQGRDRAHGAGFSLSGRTLTVTLTRTSNVRAFAGQRVRADCASQRRMGDGVARTVTWPARSRVLKVRFTAGAGPAPVYCSVDSASLRARTLHADATLK